MKYLSKSIISVLAPFAPVVLSAASFNAGCFNVRYHTNLDQGDINWDNRKPYVVKTIMDNFDIVGLNEMNNQEMQAYIQANIPGYTLAITGLSENMNPNTHQCHAIIYRTSMFDMLDEGHYWLNTDETTPGISWDCSPNIRMTHWAKMRVKTTGEEFFFFITHLDHMGDDARNEQALMNFNHVREIAGSTPVIITGDHNSAKSRLPFYNLFSSYMQDARVVSADPFTWKYDGTLCKWDPENTNTTRIDYIWARGFRVNTYKHINETYGRGVTPSDHFPIVANVTIAPLSGLYECYVRPDGRTGGDGSKRSPFQNLTEAINATAHGGHIYITKGEVSVGGVTMAALNLSKSISIHGGYNNSFSEVTGLTTIDAAGQPLFSVAAPYYLELSNMSLANAKTDGNGAAVNSAGARVILTDCEFLNCEAAKNGGAVYVAQQVLADGCTFKNCKAGNYGGAIFANFTATNLWWRYMLNRCHFHGNQAARGSAAYYSGYLRANFNNCTFSANKASYSATLSLNAASYDSKTSMVNCTFVNNSVISNPGAMNSLKGGSAIFANLKSDSYLAMANNTIIFNDERCGDATAPDDYNGAAVYLLSGQLLANNNIIAANTGNAADAVTDIRAEVSGDAYNVLTSRNSVNFTPAHSDIVGGSLVDTRSRLQQMYRCDDDGRPVVAVIDGYLPKTLVLCSHMFGNSDINMVDNSHLTEELTMADYDIDIQLKGRITGDQLGRPRSSAADATIGAIEFHPQDASGIESVADELNAIISGRWNYDEFVISAPYAIGPVVLLDITGRVIAKYKGDTQVAVTTRNLSPGHYIIATPKKSFKLAIH